MGYLYMHVYVCAYMNVCLYASMLCMFVGSMHVYVVHENVYVNVCWISNTYNDNVCVFDELLSLFSWYDLLWRRTHLPLQVGNDAIGIPGALIGMDVCPSIPYHLQGGIPLYIKFSSKTLILLLTCINLCKNDWWLICLQYGRSFLVLKQNGVTQHTFNMCTFAYTHIQTNT